jgi:hypothetical protein
MPVMRGIARGVRFLAWAALAGGLFLVALGLYDCRRDRKTIARMVHGRVRADAAPSEKMCDAAAYIRDEVADGRVDAYYRLPVFRALKPTALQVLRGGGDCAYRARALIVILDMFGVHAQKLALSDGEAPVPAVAEVETERGVYVVDVLYGVIHEEENGDPIPLTRLADPDVLAASLARARAKGNTVVAAYDERYQFRDPRTFNWEKSRVTRWAYGVFVRLLGEDRATRLGRPPLFEEPALMVACAGAAAAAGAGIYLLAANWRRRRRRRAAAAVAA